MFGKPADRLERNSVAFEITPLVKPSGFREYDARWWFGYPGSDVEPEINLPGLQALGLGLGTLMRRMGKPPEIVTGHDFRSYSQSVKQALTLGLMTAGIRVHDIGLALSPMAYFAQFALGVPSVAMVTASHNENGWTGVKMGVEPPLTFGVDEMSALRDIVLSGAGEPVPGGAYVAVSGMRQRYLEDLAGRIALKRRLKVVAACGNGTAGAFAPELLERIGCEVVPLDVELDHSFPRYNPNPEDMRMLHAIRDEVLRTGADLGFGFDGDGDRCGVVDDTGREIFADKIGLMIARDIAVQHPGSRFVVDVKSTGLFKEDPLLRENRAATEYWKTGHSHIKRRMSETGAIAAFEKSGHFFFGEPIGRGYDDGLMTAIAVCRMLDREGAPSLSRLYDELPVTYGTPTMSAHCDDGEKYDVVSAVSRQVGDAARNGEMIGGGSVRELITVNGIRIVLDDGTWGLVRASSNKPEIVVVVESPVSGERRRAMFDAVDMVLRRHPQVGPYNQTF